jgi:cytochrome c2
MFNRALIVLLLAALSCSRTEAPAPAAPATTPPAPPSIGNAAHGKQLIAQYGCNVCHAIPGTEGPQGALGPTLAGLATRPAISNGVVPNTPENLAKYVENPPALNPQSSMPALGISPPESKDIAAFLVTLK